MSEIEIATVAAVVIIGVLFYAFYVPKLLQSIKKLKLEIEKTKLECETLKKQLEVYRGLENDTKV